jgi:hypothetical protein
VLRLLAGALSTRAHLEIFVLQTAVEQTSGAGVLKTQRDSVFSVHEVPAAPADPVLAGIVRTALGRSGSGRLPDVAGSRLIELAGGRSPGVAEQIASLGPDSVVLAGLETSWLVGALRPLLGGARVVSLPLLGDGAIAGLPALRPLLTEVDAVAVFSRAESTLLATQRDWPGRSGPGAAPEVVELEVAFGFDRSAAESRTAATGGFEGGVVLMTGFPPGSPGAVRRPGHDYVRLALGPLAVAEVALDRWSISDTSRYFEVTARSRTNLWRLLHQAVVCIDLRPGSLAARETIESLLLGTPVVVPEGTVAAECAERSNGGLWYRDYRELFAAAKAIVDDPTLRDQLGRQGREWAESVHGDQQSFADEVARLVLR